jgi:hypothetical protein
MQGGAVMFGSKRRPERQANLCGHIRCQAGPCVFARVPALEQLPPGVDRVNVREAFRAQMLEAMAADREWTLHLGRLSALDGTR